MYVKDESSVEKVSIVQAEEVVLGEFSSLSDEPNLQVWYWFNCLHKSHNTNFSQICEVANRKIASIVRNLST